MNRQIVLCGGGSLAVEVAALLQDLNASGSGDGFAVTDVVSPGPARVADLSVICGGAFAIHPHVAAVPGKEHKGFLVCTGDPAVRHAIYCDLVDAGLNVARIIHPMAYVAPTAIIEAGAIIYPGAFVGPFAHLGANVLLNAQAVVGHDACLGKSVVLSPGARLCGHAACGAMAFLGTGASILPKVSLGDRSKLAAGSVLTRSVGEGFLMHGNPATGRQMWPNAG